MIGRKIAPAPAHLINRVKINQEKERRNPTEISEDMPVDKFIHMAHRHQPFAERKKLLKSMEKKMPEHECFLCLKRDQFILPNLLWMCNECCMHYAIRYGSVKIVYKKSYAPQKPCDVCWKPKFHHFQINPYLCVKCAVRIGGRVDDWKKMENKYKENLIKQGIIS